MKIAVLNQRLLCIDHIIDKICIKKSYLLIDSDSPAWVTSLNDLFGYFLVYNEKGKIYFIDAKEAEARITWSKATQDPIERIETIQLGENFYIFSSYQQRLRVLEGKSGEELSLDLPLIQGKDHWHVTVKDEKIFLACVHSQDQEKPVLMVYQHEESGKKRVLILSNASDKKLKSDPPL